MGTVAVTGTGAGRGRRRRRGWIGARDGTQDGDGDEGSSGDGYWNGSENGDRSGDENGDKKRNVNANGGEGGARELGNPPHHNGSRVEYQALSFCTRHHLCRLEVALAANQQLRAQDPVPVR